MKKILTVGLIILLAIGASYIVYASNVANTKHNLSTNGGPANRTYFLESGTNADEVCVFCHTPHSGDQTTGPLWNRNYTAPSFNMYNSSTLDMTIEGSPVTISLACLSCHDGTTAFDSLLNFPSASDGSDWVWNSSNKIQSTDTSFMGTDLSNDHPISITYDPTVTPDPTEWNTANAQNYVNGIPLFDGRVECGSCHNPHDDQFGVFLRASNSGSALCLKCHIK